MTVSVYLFTSDLRLHDNPALRAALGSADEIVPLFVRDPGISAAGFSAPNRVAFLDDCLADLDSGLRKRGGRMVVRSGDVTDQVCDVVAETGAEQVHLASDVTRYAARREERLRQALEERQCRLVVHDGSVTAVAPGTVVPAGSDHFAVFTPYFRRWSQQRLRAPYGAPRKVRVPDLAGSQKVAGTRGVEGVSPGRPDGGETQGRKRLRAWKRAGLDVYEARHDDMAGDATSRLSPFLHFGALSVTELVYEARTRGGPGADAFVRQLCWRDFHHQVLAARPSTAVDDYRVRHDRWRSGAEAAEDIRAWKEGRTGYPVVDAAMRQLLHEGWMHNRARLLVGSFLTKTLYVDWRVGARHFLQLLVDGDIANNQLNWQWVAGTGTDSRPNRVLNPVLQAKRFDPDGDYVRRWVPELAGIEGRAVHEPWRLADNDSARCGDYPERIVDLADGLARFRQARDRR